MPNVHQVVAANGVLELLRVLRSSATTSHSQEELADVIRHVGLTSADVCLHDLVAANILFQRGDYMGLSTFGVRTSLLLDAINGGDITSIYSKLCDLDPGLKMYELVREGMTRQFLRSLVDRPGFGRLYICSPWINLDRKQAAMLSYAISRQEQRYGVPPEILVITRPEDTSSMTVPATLEPLQKLGATVFLNGRLHAKLYIREPGINGGFAMAIVGSQNLTKSTNIELGVKINSDGALINRLISYFLTISNYSHEAIKEV